MKTPTFKFNPNDPKGMEELMEKFGNSDMPFNGKNENGEDIEISIFTDRIAVRTFQKNNWMRINIYYADGTRTETFEK